MASRKSPKRTAKPALGGAVARGIAAVRPSVGKGSKSGPRRAASAKVAARRAPPSRRSAPPAVRAGTELAVTPPSSRRPTERETLARRCEELEAKVAELDALHARSERTVKALRDVGLALGSTLDLDQLLELILGKIAELLEADRATLYLLDEQRQRLLSRIIIGDEAKSIELPVGNGIAGNVAKFGQTIRIKDAYRDRRFSRQWDDLTGYRTRSILAAPMKNHVGRTIGVIQVLNKRLGVAGGDEFSQHDEELLTALATQAAVSIDNSRLFLSVIQKNMQLVETKEQLEHRVADLKLLFDLESAMAHAATFEDLARAVVTEAARACGAQAGGLLADEGEDGTFLYFLDLAKSDAGVRRVGMRRGEGIVGLAMARNEAQHLPPAELKRNSDHPPVSTRLGALLGVDVKSAVAMPLEGPDEQPIGALGLYNATRPGGFSQDARALLRLISANASTAVRLYLSRAEREKSRRLSSIGRLFSGVIHDLRTPMTVINGYVQLMSKTDDPSMRAEQARLVMQQFDTISSMQREVLEFARGERSVLVRKVFLEKFFGDIEEQIQREIAGMKIDLVVDLRDRGAARFDEVKIQRLVWNLARNAIEAMHGGGTLTIGVSRDRDDLVLRVSDTGTGIPEDVRHRMFGSFVTSGKRGGTGLGLSLVKKIVEEHHGSVSYETGTTGTTFTVRLPQTEHEGRTVLEANGDDAATKDPTKPRKKRERRESSTGEP